MQVVGVQDRRLVTRPRRGDPDIDACIRGRSVQIEVKRPGERPTLLQLKRIEEWRRRQSLLRTLRRRPDLLEQADLTPEEQRFIEEERRRMASESLSGRETERDRGQ